MKIIYALVACFSIINVTYGRPFPSNGFIVSFKPAQKDMAQHKLYRFVKSLDDINFAQEVEYIEPNYLYHKFQDPKFYYQWALSNTGLNSGEWRKPGLKGEDLDILKSWEVTQGSKDIIVAIIDSGVETTHEDLKDNLWVNTKELNGSPNIDDDGNGHIDDIHGYNFAEKNGNINDRDGHGTHCAGIIGAKHNLVGIKGIMNNVKIMPLKFLDDNGDGETINAVKAIYYAVDNGAKVISNSWGGGAYSQALYEAIQYAQSKGVLFVAAAGNSNSDLDQTPVYPASYDLNNIISVASSNSFGKKDTSSNYGLSSVDVFAPGNSIISTYLNNSYKRMSGTSMAAPHVSGTLGLMLSVKPNLNYAKIKSILLESVDYEIPYSYYVKSQGRVNAFNALSSLKD